jgi:hypothetical protein
MPKYRPTAEDENLYGSVKPPGAAPGVPHGTSDGAPPPADPNAPPKPGETGEPKDAETTDEETAESQNSAIVSSKFLAGPDGQMPAEGEEVLVKIVKSYGDEVEIQRANSKPNGSEHEPMMSGANDEIDAMDQKGY